MVARWSRIAVAVVSCGLAAAACSQNLGDAEATEGRRATPQTSLAPPARLSGGAALPDFASLVERYGPAVVNVAVLAKRQETSGFPGGAPSELYEFFRRFGQPMPRGDFPPQRGEGSGFIVSPDGYILTNAHVVADAAEVTVKTTDRREYTAEVVGVDERTDVAVLKIEAKNLPTVRIGDPDELRPGQWVIAIGSPFGFENSVTAGIVSATARSVPGGDASNYTRFIQTDVAVNPGNSGGPLFNLNGEVVGINSQIYSRTGGYMGLSFAVPIDVANNVKEQLIATGRVTRSRIGVSIQDVSAPLAESFGLDRPRGALIGMVEEDAPGDKAGLEPGDVILKIDDEEIETSGQVPGLIAGKKPGSKVTMEVWRDGRARDITVRPVEIREDGASVAATGGDEADEAARLGLAVRPLEPEERRQAETDGALLVVDVDGPAALAGVRPGDVILGVNGKRVKSMDELRAAAKQRKGKIVALLIERGDAQIFLPVSVG